MLIPHAEVGKHKGFGFVEFDECAGVCVRVCARARLCVRGHVRPSVRLSICLSVCPSVCLSVRFCLSICARSRKCMWVRACGCAHLRARISVPAAEEAIKKMNGVMLGG